MKCPECGNKLVEIIYGMPTAKTFEKVKNKEAKLGGCEIIYGIKQCDLYCYTCDKEYLKKELVKEQENSNK